MENLFSGKWTEIREEVTKAWNSITEDELNKTGGSLNGVVNLLQEKFGLAREEAATRLMELAVAIEGDQSKSGATAGDVEEEPTKH